MTAVRNQSEVERTRGQMLRIGRVDEIDSANARASVFIEDKPTIPLPILNQRGGQDRDWWLPAVGEQVMIFCPDGEPSNGVILGGVYCNDYPAPRKGDEHATVFRDTAVQQYNPATGVYHIELPEQIEEITEHGDNPEPAEVPMIVLTAPIILLRGAVLRAPYERTFSDQPMQSAEEYEEPEPIGTPCC
jgi:phage baseplate assembly protein gpV